MKAESMNTNKVKINKDNTLNIYYKGSTSEDTIYFFDNKIDYLNARNKSIKIINNYRIVSAIFISLAIVLGIFSLEYKLKLKKSNWR